MNNINKLQALVKKAQNTLADKQFQRKALIIGGTVAFGAVASQAFANTANFGTNADGQTLITLVCTQVAAYKKYVAGALAIWKLGAAAVQFQSGQQGAMMTAGIGVFGGLAIMLGPGIALGLFGLTGNC